MGGCAKRTHKTALFLGCMLPPIFIQALAKRWWLECSVFLLLCLGWLGSLPAATKRNRQCAKCVGSIATKSMTVKNGCNTIDAVEGLVLWISHCISRACGLAGEAKMREKRTPLLFALGVVAGIRFCFKKDCSGKPNPKGNALMICIDFL